MPQFDDTLIFGTQIDDSGFKSGLAGLDSAVTVAAGNIISQVVSAISSALAEIPKQIVAIGSEFEASMSQVAATMGITSAAEEFGQLSQAAQALNYLALAGYDANKSCAALPTVLDLASAGGIELAQASDMVTDSMSALNLSMDELGLFADKMAKASQKSNTSVNQLGQAILSVGANARVLAGGTTELMTELGILADSGTKSAEAGTALARVIKNLSTPTSTAAAELDRLGVKCYDAEGDFRNMQDIFKNLQTAMSGFTAEQVQSSLSEIFDTAALSSAKVLLSQCGDRYDELSGYIDNAAGAASEMAETMNDNLTGDITICQSAVEALANTAYEKFSGTMRTAVQSVTEEIGVLNTSMTDGELSESMDILSEAFSSAASSAAEFLADDVIPGIVNGMSAIVEHGDAIVSILEGVAASLVFLKGIQTFDVISKSVKGTITMFAALEAETTAATFQQAALNTQMSLSEVIIGLLSGKITIATAKQAAWNAVCAVNPFVLLAAAVVGITTAAIAFTKSQEEASKATRNAAEAAENAADSLDSLNNSINKNNSETQKNEDELRSKIAVYEDLRKQYEDTGEGEEQLIELTKEIQELSPTTIKFIDDESGSYLSLANSIDTVIAAMERKRNYDNAESSWNTAKDNLDDLYAQNQALMDEWDDLNNQIEGANSDQMRDISKRLKENQEARTEIAESILENEKIVADTEKEIKSYYTDNPSESTVSGGTQKNEATIAAMQHDADELAAKSKENAEKLSKQKEAVTNKLKEGWANAEHLYNVGVITSDKELYAEKARLWEEYGDDSLEAHWQYEEDLISLGNQIADDEREAAEKAADEAAKQRTEDMEQAWKDISDAEELGDLTLEEAAKKRAEFMAQYVPDPTAYHEWYVQCQKDTEDLAQLQTDAAKKQWDHIDDLESVGLLTEEEAYVQRKEWIQKYCEEGSDEWYDYYSEIYSYEEKMAQKQLENRKSMLKNELDAVKSNVSKIIDEYKSAYSDIKSNMDSYKAKLLDVGGSVFDITEKENDDGSKTKTYKVKDIQKQIDAMKKYHEAMLKLRDNGASQSLLAELMSIDDPEDGLRMAQYMLNNGNFDEINRLYTEKEQFAADMAAEFYTPEVERLNSDTADKIKAEYDTLPEEFRSIGKTAAEELINGLSEGVASLSDMLDSSLDDVTDKAESLIDSMTVSPKLPAADNTTAAQGNTDYTTAISEPASTAPLQLSIDYNANQSALSAELKALGSMLTGLPAKIAESIKEIKLAAKIYNVLELDGKTAAESINSYNKQLGEMGGT